MIERQSIPGLIRDVLTLKMHKGETMRIAHEYSNDGTPCSLDKDPCLNITRATNGFKYFCHRCHEQGYVPLSRLTPAESAALVKKIHYPEFESAYVEHEDLQLPNDGIPLVIHSKRAGFHKTDEGDSEWEWQWNSAKVPFKAMKWLWSFGLTTPATVSQYNLLWSASYNRLIFPISNIEGNLDGWVGRNVDGEKPKWLTRKSKSYKDRLLFMTIDPPASPHAGDKIVWVEDAVSAIKVTLATGYPAIALLTTTLSYEIANMFVAYDQLLWLDGDMKVKMIKTIAKLRQYGIKIKMKYTELDPKEYTDNEIQTHVKDTYGGSK